MEAGSVGGGCVKEFMRPPLLFLYTSVDSGVEFICGNRHIRRCLPTVMHHDGEGRAFEEGRLSLEELAAYGRKVGEPCQTSGKQELYDAIVNMYC